MADDDSGEDLSRLVADLVRTLRELEAELEPSGPEDGPRLPTPRDLRRLTSEVAIPSLILVLESNIRALRLLQHALRLAEGADQAQESTEQVRDRARAASETTLSRLDDALVELQDAVERRPSNDEAADLLDDARKLRAEIQERIRESTQSVGRDGDDRSRSDGNGSPGGSSEADEADESDEAGGDETDEDGTEPAAAVDVDAELESIKRELDDLPGTGDGAISDSGPASPTEGGDDGAERADADSNEAESPDADASTDDSDSADGRGGAGTDGADTTGGGAHTAGTGAGGDSVQGDDADENGEDE